MSAKAVGSIKTRSQKSVGRLYRTSASQSRNSLVPVHQPSERSRYTSNHNSSGKKRINSVGKIYNPCRFDASEFQKNTSSPKKSFHNIINYDEMEHKLSNYLACTIRTNGRQKYNYLSQHYIDPRNHLQHYSKINHYDSNVPLRKNFIQLTELHVRDANQDIGNISSKISRQSKNDYKELKRPESYLKQQSSKKFYSNKENTNWSGKQSRKNETRLKNEAKTSIFTMNHQQNKSELSNKLMKIIDSYETKNRQLNEQMERLQKQQRKPTESRIQQSNVKQIKQEVQVVKTGDKTFDSNEEEAYSQVFLVDVFTKLKEYNLKGICMTNDCDAKLVPLWKSIHQQIILDENVRIIKTFIRENSLDQIISEINSTRMKKIDVGALKTHSEEYDPFLIEKAAELFQTNKPNIQTKKSIKWLAQTFVKCYEEAEHHWLKYLSQQKMDCAIRSMILQKQIVGLRHCDSQSKDLNLRDFTRWLSTLYKANLRNRNVYQIYNKLKNMSYVGRFIELLEEKAVKGQEPKKLTSK